MLLIIINKNQNVNLIFYQFKSLLTPKCEAYFISLSKSSKLNPTNSTPVQVLSHFFFFFLQNKHSYSKTPNNKKYLQ